MIVAPGAFDPLAARCVEDAGFPAVYMTGFGTSAALLGRPDVGLATMSEMADNAGRIASCVDIPVIADAGMFSGGQVRHAGLRDRFWQVSCLAGGGYLCGRCCARAAAGCVSCVASRG